MLFLLTIENGQDVRMNPRLEKLVEKARLISMPKNTIDKAIKTGAGVSKTIFGWYLHMIMPTLQWFLTDIITGELERFISSILVSSLWHIKDLFPNLILEGLSRMLTM